MDRNKIASQKFISGIGRGSHLVSGLPPTLISHLNSAYKNHKSTDSRRHSIEENIQMAL